MKATPISLLPLFICLILAVVCLVAPPTVLAGNTASCPGGRTVSCSAYRCDCINNTGCTGYDASGRVVEDSPCPASGGFQIIALVESAS